MTTDTITVQNIETVTGSTGSDDVTVFANSNGDTFALGGGIDTLTLDNTGNIGVVVSGVDSLFSGNGNDSVIAGGSFVAGNTVDLGVGTDQLTMDNSGNTVSIGNVETITSGSGTDVVTMTTSFAGTDSVDLGDGSDTLALASTGNVLSIANVESVTGGAGSDTLTVTAFDDYTAAQGDFVNFSNSVGSKLDGLISTLDAADTIINQADMIASGTQSFTATFDNAATGRLAVVGTNINGNADLTINNGFTNAGAIFLDDFNLQAASLTVVGGDLINTGSIQSLNTGGGGTGSRTLTAQVTNQAGAVIDVDFDLTIENTGTTINNSGAIDVASGEVLTINGGTFVNDVLGQFTLTGSGAVDFANGAIFQQNGTGGDDTVSLPITLVSGATVDLQAGNDTLSLGDGGNTVSVANVETVIGGTGNDDITYLTAAPGSPQRSFDGGAGTDTVTITVGSTFNNRVRNVETIIGSSGTDLVIAETNFTSGDFVDLGTGLDTLTVSTGVNVLSATNLQRIEAGSGDDTLTLENNLGSNEVNLIDFNAGTDTLNLAAGTNITGVSQLEFLNGTASNDTLTLNGSTIGSTIDLQGGDDILNLGASANTVTLANIETIVGNTNNDDVTITTSLSATNSVDLGAGNDTLTLGDSGNFFDVAGVETLTGGAGNETIVAHSNFGAGDTVDLGAALDTLSLFAGGNTVAISGVEQINGATGIDNILLDNSGNTITVNDIETLTSGTGNDAITTNTQLASGTTFDLGAGTDTLQINLGTHAATILNTETLVGSANTDTLTLEGVSDGMTIDLAGGADSLTLTGSSLTTNVANIETITGLAGNDIVTAHSSFGAGDSVDLGLGTDTLNLGDTGNTVTVAGVESLTGGLGGDNVTFTTIVTAQTIDLSSGTDSLALADAVNNSVTTVGIETVTSGSGDDAITVSGAVGASVDGGDGVDTLFGGTGADTLRGGGGADSLTGGGGNDRFLYSEIGQSDSGSTDVITDFDQNGNDTIFLEDLVTGTINFIGAHTNSFTGGGANTEIRFNDASDLLEIDTDGDGTADMQITLTGVALGDLDNTDFDGSLAITIVNVTDGETVTMTAGLDELLLGTGANEAITLSGAAQPGDTIDLAGGTDTVILDNTANTVTLFDVETLTAGTAVDAITVRSFSGNFGDLVDTLDGADTFTNATTLKFNAGTDSIAAVFVNDATGLLEMEANSGVTTADFTVANGISNAGTVLFDVGGGNSIATAQLTVTSGDFVNTGLIQTVQGGGSVSSVHSIVMTAGSLDNQGTIDVDQHLTITNGATLVNSGGIDVASGEIFTVSGGIAQFDGGTSFAAGTGTMALTNSADLVLNTDVTMSTASLSMSGSAGDISGANTLTVSSGADFNQTTINSAFVSSGTTTATQTTFAGGTTVSGGLLRFTGGGTGDSVINGTFDITAGTVEIEATTAGATTDVVVASGFTNAGTIRFDNITGNSIVNNSLSVTAGDLTNTGTIQSVQGSGSSSTVYEIAMTAGNLLNQGNIDVDQHLTVTNGGTLVNTGGIDVAAGETLSVSGGVTQLNAGTSITAGTGEMALTNSADLVLNTDVTFSTASLSMSGAAGDVSGAGTLTVGAGADFDGTTINAAFVNTGTTVAQETTFSGGTTLTSGTLRFNSLATGDSAINGAFDIAAAGTLEIEANNGGTAADVLVASGFTNAGTIRFDNITGNSIANNSLTVTAGNLTNTGTIQSVKGGGSASSVNQINMTAGNLVNSGDFDVDQHLTINGGTLVNSSGIDVASGQDFTVSGGVVQFDAGSSITAGTGTMVLSNSTDMVLNTDVTFSTASLSMSGSAGDISGAGTLTVGAGADFDGTTINSAFVNTGTTVANEATFSGGTTVTSGTLRFNAQGTGDSVINGAFDVAAAGTLEIEANNGGTAADVLVASGLTNAGTIRFDNVTGNSIANNSLTVTAGNLVNTGTILSVQGSGSPSSVNNIVMTAGDLDNQGTIDVDQHLTLTNNADFLNSGDIDVASGETLTISGGSFVNAATGTASGSGSIVLAGGATFTQSSTAGNDDVSLPINLTAGETIDLAGGTDTLTLRDGGNTLSVVGTETVNGGSGNDIVSVADGTPVHFIGGSGDDTFASGAGNDTFDGGAGNDDAVDYSDAVSGIFVEMSLAGAQTIGGGEGVDTLSNVENLIGSAFGDDIEGDANNNSINAGAGDDLIFGAGGIDTLTGGTGADIFGYVAASDSATGARDIITDFDAGTSSTSVDIIQLEGLATGTVSFIGASTFSGGGDTEIRFIDGSDILRIDLDGSGSADMEMELTGVAIGNLDIGDFAFFDVIEGTAGNDVLVGTADDDLLDGNGGNDTYYASLGDDTIFDNSGTDMLHIDSTFEFEDAVVDTGTGDLVVTLSTDDGATLHTVTIEDHATGPVKQVRSDIVGDDGIADVLDVAADFGDGSSTNDTIFVGSDGAETLQGGTGNDILFGNAGNDTLTGGSNDDTLYGGAGDDDLQGISGNDTVSYDLETAAVTVNLTTGTAVGASSGTDTIASTENVIGTDFNDTITGDAGINILQGGEGNDTLDGSSGADTLEGEDGNDKLIGGAGADTLDGGTGVNVLIGGAGDDILTGSTRGTSSDLNIVDYSDETQAVTVTLSAIGTATGTGIDTDTLTNIDKVIGSSAADNLTADSTVSANFGTFVEFVGGDGNDTINGNGNTRISFEDATTSGVTVTFDSAGSGTATGDASVDTDTFTGVNSIRGTDFDDTVTGSNNSFESFRMLAGNDTIDGGAGTDRADYANSTSGIGVNLSAGDQVINSVTLSSGEALDGFGGTDTLSNIEEIRGSNHDDVVVASASGTRFRGQGGADSFTGGAGDDRIDMRDTAATQGAQVDLVNGTAVDGTGATDTFTSVEDVRGSHLDDTILGDGSDNFIQGEDGDDSIDGGAGSDQIIGGDGNDTLDGGAGTDLLNMSNSGDRGVVVDLANGFAVDSGGFVDTISGFEDVVGGLSDDILLGDANANDLTGFDGVDTLYGAGGSDFLLGGVDGDGDLFVYKAASESVVGTGDTIGDFEEGTSSTAVDQIVLDGLLTGTFSFLGDETNAFTATGNTEARFNDTSDLPEIDTDGDGLANMNITLSGVVGSNLDASDFLVTAPNLVSLGTTGNDSIDGGAGRDSFLGDTGDDTLVGAGGSDFLDGEDGDDRLIGGGGNDFLDGGLGSNILEGRAGDDLITADLGFAIDDFNQVRYTDGSITGGIIANLSAVSTVAGDASVGTDVLGTVDRLVGTAFDDVVFVDSTISGNFGNFVEIRGGAGNDIITGNGNTRVNYDDATSGVTVDLSTGTATSAETGTDIILGGVNAVRGSNSSDVITGTAADETFRPRQGADTVDGGGGTDKIDYRGQGAGVTVDLANGTAVVSGATDTLLNIEDIRGSENADTLTGNAGDNVIQGQDGADVIDGGSGGNDTVNYQTSNTSGVVQVDLSAGTAVDQNGDTDTLSNIDNVIGGDLGDDITGDNNANTLLGKDGADTLRGQGGADTLIGGDGDDLLIGGGGNDVIDGGVDGDDFNTASYNGFSDGITVDLTTATGTVTGTSAGTDTLTGIDRIIGTTGNDTFTVDADYTANFGAFVDIRGGAGDDTITNADPTNATVRANFQDAGAAVSIDLGATTDTGTSSSGTATGTGIGTDTLNDVTDVRASNFADTIIGSDRTDRRESFRGQSGNDTIDGGGGTDRADYLNSSSGVTVDLSTGTALDGFGDTDTLSNIEDVRGFENGDTITGDSANNKLDGRDGNDTLSGLGGDDSLSGGDGDDSLIGGDGNDTLSGGSGFNKLIGGDGDDLLIGGSASATNSDFDVASYRSEVAGITVTLSGDGSTTNSNVIDGLGNTDTLQNIESILGSDFDDVFSADGTFVAKFGDFNQFEGFAGNDVITGNGSTRISFNSATGSVFVDMTNGTATGDSSVGFDRFTGVNSVRGSAHDDEVLGSSADESFRMMAGNDRIDGGDGTDRVDYRNSSSAVTVDLIAGTGTDGFGGIDQLLNIENIRGSTHGDFLFGDENANSIRGQAGNDLIDGGDGVDEVDFRDNDATEGAIVHLASGFAIDGTGDVDTLIGIEDVRGTSLDDLIVGDAGANKLRGNAGNDTLDGGDGNDDLRGEDGDDVIMASRGNDVITSGVGSDTVVLSLEFGLENILRDSATDDLVISYVDSLDAGHTATVTDHYAGFSIASMELLIGDVQDGLATFDMSSDNGNGSSTNNTIFAGTTGAETLQGGSGDDLMFGNAGNDTLDGGAGDDLMFGGDGDDNFVGGSGIDAVVYANSGSAVVVNLSTGTATGQGTDTLSGIEEIEGSAFGDTITGSTGNDILFGEDGSDILNGGDGDDILNGGVGGDTITGGAGADTITLGSGADIVNYDASTESDSTNTDTIFGFDAIGSDVIDISSYNANVSGINFFVGAHTESFTGTGASARFNDTTKVLEIDTDGNSIADANIVLDGVNIGDLDDSDFLFATGGA